MKLKSLLIGLALLGAAFTVPAGQLNWGTFNIPTDLVWIVTGTSNSTSGTAIDVPQGVDMIIMPSIKGAGATTSNNITGFDVTVDGTNYTTTGALQVTNFLTGSTVTTGYGIITARQLAGVKKMRFSFSSTPSVQIVTNLAIYYGFYY